MILKRLIFKDLSLKEKTDTFSNLLKPLFIVLPSLILCITIKPITMSFDYTSEIHILFYLGNPSNLAIIGQSNQWRKNWFHFFSSIFSYVFYWYKRWRIRWQALVHSPCKFHEFPFFVQLQHLMNLGFNTFVENVMWRIYPYRIQRIC